MEGGWHHELFEELILRSIKDATAFQQNVVASYAQLHESINNLPQTRFYPLLETLMHFFHIGLRFDLIFYKGIQFDGESRAESSVGEGEPEEAT